MLARLPPMLLALLGVFTLSVMDALIKQASLAHAAVTVAFWRYFFGLLAAGSIWLHAGRPAITGEMWRAHTLRGVITGLVGLTFFYALGVLPLAEAVTFAFLAPLVIPFASWALLGERVRAGAMTAALIGFAGAVIAAQGLPSEADRHPDYMLGIASALASAALYAVGIALLRQRAGRDGAPIVGLMQTLVPALMFVGPAFMLAPMPALADLPLFASIGFTGALGWYVLIHAYARAEAQRLAPLEFTALLWASLLGLAFFQETPRIQVLAGGVVIIVAVSFGEWAARRTQAAPATAD